jgi:4-hydroxy-2-oxoheptanedioate aldolase
MDNFLRQSWKAARPSMGIWSAIGNPLLAEAIASVGPDYVCVDMQHGESHDGNLIEMFQAIAIGGSVPIARVPSNDPASIMRVLDSGAQGVVVPLVESAEQAARAVDACRFPPKGTRSYGPFRASIRARTSDTAELEKVACIVMIETRAGIDNLEEIVATEGVTAAYVGPSDLSLALGLSPGSTEAPEFVSTLAEIRAACVRHDIVPGLHCYDGKMARRAAEQGFGMITVAVDLRSIRAWIASELEQSRAGSA